MSDTNNHQPFGPRSTPLLRAHRRAFVLLLFYIPLVLIPWVITMLLVYRPAMRSYWTYPSSSPKHTSPGYSEVIDGFQWKDYKQQRGWTRAIPIMNAFAAILTIPVTSTVLAQAAVVFAQRRSSGQQLSVRHLFSLADRAWLDWGLLHKMLYWHEAGSKRVKMFVFGGAILVICGAIQYPLIQITVPWEQISVPTCYDTSFITDFDYSYYSCDVHPSNSHGYRLLGNDLEPAQMANLPAHEIVPHIVDDLSTIEWATLPNFWRTPDDFTYRLTSYRFLDLLDDKAGFVAALPADTTTGVLREHIMRLNSSVSCTNLTVSAWPSTCSGTNPFQASFHYTESYYETTNLTIDVCAPGNMGKHPWTFSRNRQELSEEVFFRFTGREAREENSFNKEDDVVHCTAQTARGYFELGNAYNGGAFGPLLEKWSDVAQSHDFVEPETYGHGQEGFHPSEEDTWVGSATPAPSNGDQLPGPLTTSLLALFGPSSWAANIANLTANRTQANLDATSDIPSGFLTPLCAAGPFASTNLEISSIYTGWCTKEGLAGLRGSLSALLLGWDDPETVKKWLDIAVYVANRATLTSHAHSNRVPDWYETTGREIYTAEGLKVYKPSPSIAAQVILTLIVMVHVFGLLGLAWFIQLWPAWTRTLDSMAVARVAASLDPSLLPPLKTARLSARTPLKDVDGLVGIQEAESVHADHVRAGESQQEGMEMETLSIASTAGKQATSSATPMMAATGAGSVELGLGAPGVIAKRGKKQVAPSAAVADV